MFAKELMLRTCGANGKHQWCWVLNALQYLAKMKAIYCCHTSDIVIILYS